MRFHVLILYLFASFMTMINASLHSDETDLSLREFDDIVFDAREVLEDLGMHTRALHDFALSARRFDELEARIAELEGRGEDKGSKARPKHVDPNDPNGPKGPFKCPCGAEFTTHKDLSDHQYDRPGHWKR